MRRGFLIIVLLVCCSAYVSGQNSVEKMKQQKAEIERQVAASEKLLNSTDKDIKSQVATLNTLSGRLKQRRKLLDEVRSEIKLLDRQSDSLTVELKELQKNYDECKERYAAACRFYQQQHSSFNPLLFLFSAKDYRQLSRRFRYVKEYSTSVNDLADEIAEHKAKVEEKKLQIDALKKEKTELQNELAEQEGIARSEEQKQRTLVSKLKSKRSTLKKEIDKQQKQITALGKEIDKQIAAALKASKKGKQTAQESEKDIKLTGSFESNKGKLPVPITGTYLVAGDYGIQNVAGLKDVKLNNLGIDLQGEKGAQARAVYDGTVTTVFQQGKGQIGVLVRHGSYISVYCNLSDTRVAKGDNVKTGDIIGNIGLDADGRTVLHFQLHKETAKLNPSDWLRK